MRGRPVAYLSCLFDTVRFYHVGPDKGNDVTLMEMLDRFIEYLSMVLIQLFELREYPIHPVITLLNEGMRQISLEVVSKIHSCKYNGVVH